MARNSNSKFFKQLAAYEDKTKRQRDYIAKHCVLELGNAAQTPQFGVKWTGGRFEVGKIPIDTQRMIKSFTVAINFRIAARGRYAHEKAADAVKPGDRVQFWWAVPYAKRIEFGFSGQDILGRRFNQKGRFFATTAINRWTAIKRGVIERSKSA